MHEPVKAFQDSVLEKISAHRRGGEDLQNLTCCSFSRDSGTVRGSLLFLVKMISQRFSSGCSGIKSTLARSDAIKRYVRTRQSGFKSKAQWSMHRAFTCPQHHTRTAQDDALFPPGGSARVYEHAEQESRGSSEFRVRSSRRVMSFVSEVQMVRPRDAISVEENS